MRIFIVALFLQAPFFVQAQSSIMLACRGANKGGSLLLVLDAVGAGSLKFQKPGDKQLYTCPLKIEYIHDGQKGVVPEFVVDFDRGACNPESSQTDKDLLKKITLVINLNQKENPQGRVQWLKKKHPDKCKVEKINALDLSQKAKKWAEGTWGKK